MLQITNYKCYHNFDCFHTFNRKIFISIQYRNSTATYTRMKYCDFKLRLSLKHNSHRTKRPIKKIWISVESDADCQSKRISKSYAICIQAEHNTHKSIGLKWALFSVKEEVINECYLYWLCFFLAYTASSEYAQLPFRIILNEIRFECNRNNKTKKNMPLFFFFHSRVKSMIER